VLVRQVLSWAGVDKHVCESDSLSWTTVGLLLLPVSPFVK
jgi:hypothetical protein